MKEIGKFLKENREKLEMSIGDISNATKMNVNIIRNIEEGNVAYFSNDLTYLKYYVRSYSNVVNVDFESIESELERSTLTYTQSIEILEKEKISEINENINVKRRQISTPPNRGGIKHVGKSIDWTLVSLITIVVLILGFLVYSVTINILNKDEIDSRPPIVEQKPGDKEADPEEETPIEEEPIIEAVKIVKEDPNNYLISNWQDQNEFSIKTLFAVNTWTQIKVNDQVINIPGEKNSSKTFTPGEELVIIDKYTLNNQETEFKAGDVISIRYGIMRGNKFIINDEEYPLDESIANATGGTDVIFKLDQEVE